MDDKPLLYPCAASDLDVHDGRLHQCHYLAGFTGKRMHFTGADSEHLAGILHLANGHKAVADGRAQQVDLEFGGDHFAAFGSLGQAGIATGTVHDAGDGASVDKALLL